jgi:hypothetical protein
MSYVFISHSHHDGAYVEELAQHLKAMGIEVWFSGLIEYGSEWPREIEEKLDGASALVLVATPASHESSWVRNELNREKRAQTPIFPVLLDGEPWLDFETTQYVDARGGSLSIEEVAARISRALGAPSEIAPPAPTPARRRFTIEVADPPRPGNFEGQRSAYFPNVWVMNHTASPLVLEFDLTLLSKQFPAGGQSFNEVRFGGAMAFHEVYRRSGESVQAQYLSNPLSLDPGATRMGSLAFIRASEVALIPDQQYEDWVLGVSDVHAGRMHTVDSVGRRTFD